MYFKKQVLVIVLTLAMFFSIASVRAQCYPDEVVTAAYATGGLSPYINDVLWLTWGSSVSNQGAYPYGRHDQHLGVGSKSRASIDLGDGKYLCIEAEITAIDGDVNSYAPGNYSGDYLDDLYNIGGLGSNNKLVSGIINRNDGGRSRFTIRCRATLDGMPIRLPGVVFADAESLSSTEYIYATADGNWTLVEVKKNTDEGAYYVRKENISGSTRKTMKFLQGNNKNTMAVAFLKFNESAYNKTGDNPDFSVEIEADLKGHGLTAIALGLLAPAVDGGDAPASYGNPLHLIQKLNFTDDKIGNVNAPTFWDELLNPNNYRTNVNANGYTPGALVPNTKLSHLGSTPPDTETVAQNSRDAMGDNNAGPAGPLEEDAWPEAYTRFSYKSHYMPGNKITASIRYKNPVSDTGYIAGWIDFNLNGKFDPDEKVEVAIQRTPGNSNRTATLEWIVPETRVPYSTYVRLRLSELPNMTPDGFYNTGEVEDHRIYIMVPTVTNPMIHSKVRD